MKAFKRLSFVLMTAALFFTACNPTPAEGPTPTAMALMLSVDKASITADGRDKATFTEKSGTEAKRIDVTTEAVIKTGDTE